MDAHFHDMVWAGLGTTRGAARVAPLVRPSPSPPAALHATPARRTITHREDGHMASKGGSRKTGESRKGMPGGQGGKGQSGADQDKTDSAKTHKAGYGSSGSKGSGGTGSSQGSGGGQGGHHG
jgi:hypothetical protein